MVSLIFVFFKAEGGIRDLVRSRGLGDVYKRQPGAEPHPSRRVLRPAPVAATLQAVADDVGDGSLLPDRALLPRRGPARRPPARVHPARYRGCLLYTSDAADERSSVDLGGRRIIKKKKQSQSIERTNIRTKPKQYTLTAHTYTVIHNNATGPQK